METFQIATMKSEFTQLHGKEILDFPIFNVKIRSYKVKFKNSENYKLNLLRCREEY